MEVGKLREERDGDVRSRRGMNGKDSGEEMNQEE